MRIEGAVHVVRREGLNAQLRGEGSRESVDLMCVGPGYEDFRGRQQHRRGVVHAGDRGGRLHLEGAVAGRVDYGVEHGIAGKLPSRRAILRAIDK